MMAKYFEKEPGIFAWTQVDREKLAEKISYVRDDKFFYIILGHITSKLSYYSEFYEFAKLLGGKVIQNGLKCSFFCPTNFHSS